MKMSLFIDYHGISKIAKIRITLIVCLSSVTHGQVGATEETQISTVGHIVFGGI